MDKESIINKYLERPYIEKDGKIIYLDDPTGINEKEEALISNWVENAINDKLVNLISSKSFRGELLNGDSVIYLLLLQLIRLNRVMIGKMNEIIKLLGKK